MVPYGVKGTVKEIKAGEFTVEEVVAVVATDTGDRELTLMQKWLIRKGRPYQRKLPPKMPLVTGQRVIDTFFPIAKGGVAAVPDRSEAVRLSFSISLQNGQRQTLWCISDVESVEMR